MKMKNLTNRNIYILPANKAVEDNMGNKGFARGARIAISAQSTLELTDAEFAAIELPVKELKEAGVIEVTESPVTKLTKDEIISKVMLETDVELKKGNNTVAQLQAKAEALGVEV